MKGQQLMNRVSNKLGTLGYITHSCAMTPSVVPRLDLMPLPGES